MFMRSIRAVGWAFGSTLRHAGRLRLWGPFVLVALVEAILLILLVEFHRPLLQPLFLPLIRWVGGEAATHYPVFYQALPAALARLEILLAVILLSWTTGAATLLFAAALGRDEGNDVWGRALRRFPALVGFALVTAVVVFGVFQVGRLVPSERILHDGTIRWGTRAGLLGLGVLVQSFLVTGTAFIMLRGRSLAGALSGSLAFGLRNLVPLALVLAIPVLVKYPVTWLSSRGDLFVRKFVPETMSTVLGVDIFLGMILSFLTVGTITAYFLWRQEEGR